MADYGNGGELVNTSQNYVNAYNGQAEAFDSHNTLSPQMKTYYNTVGIENTRAKKVFAQFGRKQPLPENHGTTLERRRPNTFPDVEKLVEGVIPKGQKFGYSFITMQIYEYGAYTATSKYLQRHAIDPVLQDQTVELTDAGTRTFDKLVRNELLSGTNVFYAPKNSGGSITPITSRYDIEPTCTLDQKSIAKVNTQFAADEAPKIEGASSIAIAHPHVIFDLRQSQEWIDWHKYAKPEEIFNGEVGMLHGTRFIEDPRAKIIKEPDLASDSRGLKVNGAVGTASTTIPFDGGTVEAHALKGRFVTIGGTKVKVTDNTGSALTIETAMTAADNAEIWPWGGGKDGAAVYVTTFITKDAYDVVDPEGGGMRIIIKDAAQAGGPLEQFGTIGVWFECGAKIVYEERICRVESGSSWDDTAVAN